MNPQRKEYWKTILSQPPGSEGSTGRTPPLRHPPLRHTPPRHTPLRHSPLRHSLLRSASLRHPHIVANTTPPQPPPATPLVVHNNGLGTRGTGRRQTSGNLIGTRKGRKEATCESCSLTFKRRYDLVQHENAVHRKIKPYKCEQCEQKFGHKGTLSKHVRTVHNGEKPFRCVHCGQRFSEKGNANKHLQRAVGCRRKEEERRREGVGQRAAGTGR